MSLEPQQSPTAKFPRPLVSRARGSISRATGAPLRFSGIPFGSQWQVHTQHPFAGSAEARL